MGWVLVMGLGGLLVGLALARSWCRALDEERERF